METLRLSALLRATKALDRDRLEQLLLELQARILKEFPDVEPIELVAEGGGVSLRRYPGAEPLFGVRTFQPVDALSLDQLFQNIGRPGERARLMSVLRDKDVTTVRDLRLHVAGWPIGDGNIGPARKELIRRAFAAQGVAIPSKHERIRRYVFRHLADSNRPILAPGVVPHDIDPNTGLDALFELELPQKTRRTKLRQKLAPVCINLGELLKQTESILRQHVTEAETALIVRACHKIGVRLSG